MALSFKDPETESLAREVAGLTGESLTQTVKTALRERLKRERILRGHPPMDRAAIDALTARFKTLPIQDARSEDDILGYDPGGLPS